MEHLNSVILRGIIENARIQNIGDTQMARFSVATKHAYKSRLGEAVIETTWHQVTAFKSDNMPDFTALVKGACVEVRGRLRNNRYTDSNGVERIMTEILASQVSVLGGALP
jgi:single-strand DNA-binding protein